MYNSVNTDFFLPLKKEKTLQFNFLITGNIGINLGYRVLSAIKGLYLAKKSNYDFKLILAGIIDKTVLNNCLYLVKKLNLFSNFHYVGAYTQNNAPKIYQSADAYIMLKYKDPCPNTVIEAMSCGLPVLYSNSGGLPEIVGKKCGVPLYVKDTWEEKNIFPTNENIAKGMIKIYLNHKKMSILSRQKAIDKFNIKNWIQRHNIVFNRVIKK